MEVKIDLDGTLDKNTSNELIKPVQELAQLVTEISSKMHKLKTYNEAVNDLINRNRQQKAIDEEF